MSDATATPTAPAAEPAKIAPAENPSFAAAAKYERELRAAREEKAQLEARLKEIEPRVSALDGEVSEFRKWKSSATTDLDAFMKPVLGDKWYEAATKAKLGDDASLQVRAVRDELKAELEAERKKWAEKEAAEQKAAEDEKTRIAEERTKEEEDYRSETKAYVTEHKAEYEVIDALGLHEVVANRPKQHFEQTKKVLSYKEAADLVEKELDTAIEKVLGTKKWQGRMAEMAKATQPTRVAPEFSPRKAVSNDLAAGTTQQNKRLSRTEREANAIKKLEEWEAARPKV